MTRRALFFLAIALLPAALGACAAGGAGAASTGRNQDLLTLEDFQNYQALDAYSVIRRLRGNWLATRSTTTMIDPNIGVNQENQIQVYIDGVLRTESVEALKLLSISEVREMRHLDSRDATMQFGTDHGAGAILITTR